MLDKNSARMAALLLKDEDIKVETAEIIEQLFPEVTYLLEGDEAVISARLHICRLTFPQNFLQVMLRE